MAENPENRDRRDPRPDIQQAVEARSDAAAAAAKPGQEQDDSPLADPGADIAGEGGADGIVRNQQ